MDASFFKNRERLFQPLIGWCLALLVLSVPYSAALANIFSIAVVVFWFFGGTVQEDCKLLVRQPFVRVSLVLIVLACLSLLWTQVEIDVALDGLKKFRKFIFLFVCWVYISRESVWRERLLKLMLYSFGIMAILCIGVYLDIPGLPEQIPGQGAVLSRSHISQGYIMSVLTVIGLGYLLAKKENYILRIFAGGVAVLSIIVTFFMTNGRTGYLCIFFALALMIVGYNCNFRKKAYIFLSLVLIVGIMGVNSSNVVSRITEVKSDISTFMQGNNTTSSGLRLSFWGGSLKMIKENPILGVGIGSWDRVFCLQNAQNKCAEKDMCYKKRRLGNPHSDILNFASQLGIVGLCCWIMFIVICMRKAWNNPDEKERVFAMGLLGAYLAGGMINSFFWDVIEGFILCLTMAWVLSSARCCSELKNSN